MKTWKVIPFALGTLFLLIVAGIAAIGFLVPAERSYANTVEINAPIEKVWQVITDKPRFPEWHPYMKKVEIKDDSHWIESSDDDTEPWKFSVVKDAKPDRLEIQFSVKDALSGKWVGDASATETGTRLKTVDSERIDNPLTRIITFLFIDRDKYAKGWNSSLKAQVEKLGR